MPSINVSVVILMTDILLFKIFVTECHHVALNDNASDASGKTYHFHT